MKITLANSGYLRPQLFFILLGITFFLNQNMQAQTEALFAFQNMPGENEITNVSMLDHCPDPTMNSCYKSLFAGYFIENNKKKLMIGKFNKFDNTLPWVKSIEVDSLVSIAGITKFQPFTADTFFNVVFNFYDIASAKTRIGVIHINSLGTITWSRYYSIPGAGVIANSISSNRIVGRSDHIDTTKALFLLIHPLNGDPVQGQCNEIVINNSNYQELEYTEKSQQLYCNNTNVHWDGGHSSGTYSNPGFGLDWFHYGNVYPQGVITTCALPGDQNNTLVSRATHQCSGNFANVHLYFRSEGNKLCRVVQNQQYSWAAPKLVKTFSGNISLSHLIESQNYTTKLYLQYDSTNRVTFDISNNPTSTMYSLPNTDIGFNAMMGIGYFGLMRNNCGWVQNANTNGKAAFIGDLSGVPLCVNQVDFNQVLTNMPSCTQVPKVITDPPIDTGSISFLSGILTPALVPFCVNPPVVINGQNFGNPVCPGSPVKIKLGNPPNAAAISATLNGISIPFNPADSTFTITGMLSAPSDTFQVIYQTLAGAVNKDTVFNVYPLATFTINTQPAPPVVCNGQAVTFTASGVGNTYTWTGGIQNGVAFVPAATNTFTVTSTDGNGCTYTASQLVTVSPVFNVTITALPANDTICWGNTATLTASGGNSYVWSGGIQNGIAFSPVFTNTYTVTATNAGCSITATKTMVVSYCGACLSNVIITTSPYNIVYTESSNWIKTSGLVVVPSGALVKLDADSLSYVKFEPGFKAEYGSVFTAEPYNGCGAGAPQLPMNKAGFSENTPMIQDDQLLIFPNPVSGQLSIQCKNEMDIISVYDLTGKLLQRNKVKGQTETQIDMNQFANGSYIIKVDGYKPVKVLKQ